MDQNISKWSQLLTYPSRNVFWTVVYVKREGEKANASPGRDMRPTNTLVLATGDSRMPSHLPLAVAGDLTGTFWMLDPRFRTRPPALYQLPLIPTTKPAASLGRCTRRRKRSADSGSSQVALLSVRAMSVQGTPVPTPTPTLQVLFIIIPYSRRLERSSLSLSKVLFL